MIGIILYIVCGLIVGHFFAKYMVSQHPHDKVGAGMAILIGFLVWPVVIIIVLAFYVGKLYIKENK